MDKFLDIYGLPKLNQNQMNNLNSSITPSEIKAVIRSITIQKRGWGGKDQTNSAQNSTRPSEN